MLPLGRKLRLLWLRPDDNAQSCHVNALGSAVVWLGSCRPIEIVDSKLSREGRLLCKYELLSLSAMPCEVGSVGCRAGSAMAVTLSGKLQLC